jgi:hypothetical protein
LALVASPHPPPCESRKENGIMFVTGLQRPFATLSARKRHMHRNKQTKLVSLRSLLSPCNITNNRPIGGDKSALYFGVGVCPTNVFLAT